VAPSAVPFDGQIWKVDPATGIGAMVASPTPRALTPDEIKGVVRDFRRAARNAMNAGFDGVEIHGANGYLIDQFLRTTSNVRTDEYGGSRENRLRFLKEVINAVTDEVGAARTAIRLAPFLTARGMACPDILPTILEAAEFLQARGIAYLHLVAFGRPFVANPDFPRRLADDLPLASFDGSTLFGGDERGYADYPALPKAEVSASARDAVSVS
jgi:N-ethylmaleimide reductase